MKKSTSRSVMSKGKSFSTIQVSNTGKQSSIKKESRVLKASSCIKIQQPLSIQNRQKINADSRITNSKVSNKNQSLKIEQKTKVQSYNKEYKQIRNGTQILNNNSHNESNKVPVKTQTQKRNQLLMKQNRELRQKYCKIQQASLDDKQKIKTLISRISELKREKSNTENQTIQSTMQHSKATASYAQLQLNTNLNHKEKYQQIQNRQIGTPFRIIQTSTKKGSTCTNPGCEQRKKYLQSQLYKQRIKRDDLQQQKKQWQKNRQHLRRQYRQLLSQIKVLRQDQNQQ